MPVCWGRMQSNQQQQQQQQSDFGVPYASMSMYLKCAHMFKGALASASDRTAHSFRRGQQLPWTTTAKRAFMPFEFCYMGMRLAHTMGQIDTTAHTELSAYRPGKCAIRIQFETLQLSKDIETISPIQIAKQTNRRANTGARIQPAHMPYYIWFSWLYKWVGSGDRCAMAVAAFFAARIKYSICSVYWRYSISLRISFGGTASDRVLNSLILPSSHPMRTFGHIKSSMTTTAPD